MDEMLAEMVDRRSDELINEFMMHKKEVQLNVPSSHGMDDQIFQGWALQKIAGLQIAVEGLAVANRKYIERLSRITRNA